MFDDAFVRGFGFESVEEFHRLNAASDYSTPEKDAAYRHWQFEDGTKAGLLALHAKHGTRGPPKLATDEQIKSIMVSQFGIDIRSVELDGRRFEVTVGKDGEAEVICEWDNLPPGHSFNGHTVWWVQKWYRSKGPLPEEFLAVAAAAIATERA